MLLCNGYIFVTFFKLSYLVKVSYFITTIFWFLMSVYNYNTIIWLLFNVNLLLYNYDIL